MWLEPDESERERERERLIAACQAEKLLKRERGRRVGCRQLEGKTGRLEAKKRTFKKQWERLKEREMEGERKEGKWR